MSVAFIGSEAVAAGRVSKYHLRTRYQRVFPDVYAPPGRLLTLAERTGAAWLWSKRQGVVSGLAASAMHGAKWVDSQIPIDLNYASTRPPAGIATHTDILLPNEYQLMGGIGVTTPARTAFDLARWIRDDDDAVVVLDALGNATGLRAQAVEAVARAHPGARRLRDVEAVLDLYDPGAQSPQESRLRLLVVHAGFRRPVTQIPVDCGDGYPRYYLDMGWPDLMIALEYDGQYHYEDAAQIRNDIRRYETLAAMDWIVVRVVAGMSVSEVLYRLRRAAREAHAEREILAG